LGNQKIKKMDLSQVNFTPIDGEIMQNSTDDKFYVWKDENWHEVKMENSGFEMGLYDMNKQIITQLPTITDLAEKEEVINKLHQNWGNYYYMLYGKEISYFTLFEMGAANQFGLTVVDCLKSIGPIKAIDLTELEDAVEIWVISNDEPTCLYLFPYDNGVVKVGE
jgi:hypothetical protein